MPELNPNHRVTMTLHDQWHAVCLMVMRKLGVKEVVITEADLIGIDQGSLAIVAHDKADGLHIRVVTMEEGQRLARAEGGLPV